MNSLRVLFYGLPLLALTLFMQSTSSLGKWDRISAVPYPPKANLYRRQFYGYNYGLEKSSLTPRLRNSVGTWLSVPQIMPSKTRSYQRPFYGLSRNLKRTFSTPRHSIHYGTKTNNHLRPMYSSDYRNKHTASRLQNTFGNERHFPWKPYSRKVNINYQRPPYDANHLVKQAFSTAQIHNGIGSKRNFALVNYAQKKSYSRPFYDARQNLKQTFSAAGRQSSFGSGSRVLWVPYVTKKMLYTTPSYISNHEHKQTPQYQNAILKRRKVSWIMSPTFNIYKKRPYFPSQDKRTFLVQKPPNGITGRRNVPWVLHDAETDRYRKTSQVPNYKVKTTIIPQIYSGLLNKPYGRKTKPEISQWISLLQRSRIPYAGEMKESRIPSFVPALGSTVSTINYRRQQNALRRMLQPISGQSNRHLNNNDDISLQDILAQVSPSEDQLIPENIYSKQTASKMADLEYVMGKDQRPVPRTTFTLKENRLRDAQLIKLRQILQSMRKRSVTQVNVVDKKGLVYTGLHSNSRPSVERSSSFDSYNHNADKRSFEKLNKKKSSIRKVKGRQNWGFLNEFSPNFRLATMILLKQKRHDMQKREIKYHSRSLGKSSGRETMKRRATTSESGKDNHRGTKRSKSNRSFVREGNNGFYFYPERTSANSPFLLFGAIVPRQRYLIPFFDTEEQIKEAQMEMENRMRAMRFPSLINVSPQFLNYYPLQHSVIPIQQPSFSMQDYRLVRSNIPFQYRLSLPLTRNHVDTPWSINMREIRESRGLKSESSSQEESSNLAPISQGYYDQEESPEETGNDKSTDFPSQANRGKFDDNIQKSFQKHRKAFEGFSIVNSRNINTSNQDLKGNTNPKQTGMQINDQSNTMLNGWYPVRVEKVAVMSDPRRDFSQWSSHHPGLEVVSSINKYQGAVYAPIFRHVYQDTKEGDKDEGKDENADKENNIEGQSVRFHRKYLIQFPGYSIDKRVGSVPVMNGTWDEGDIPHSNKMTLDDQRQMWKKRNVLHRAKKTSRKKEHLVKESGLDQALNGVSKSGKTNFSKRLVASERKRYTIFNVKKMIISRGHSGETGIRKNKTFTGKHFSDIGRKERARKGRNFINMGYYGVNPGMTPDFLTLTRYYSSKPVIPGRNPTPRLMTMEYPINAIERKGYFIQNGISGVGGSWRRWPFQYSAVSSVQQPNKVQELAFSVKPPQSLKMSQNGISGVGGLLRRWPFQYSAVSSVQQPINVQELAFPVKPPQSLLKMSQKVDQFPPKVFFPIGDLAQRQASYATRVFTKDSDQSSGLRAKDIPQGYSQGHYYLDNGVEDFPEESGSNFISSLVDGLDQSQAILHRQQPGGLLLKKGDRAIGTINCPFSENPLQFVEPEKRLLQQNSMARQKVLFQQRPTFGTKGKIKEGAFSGQNGNRLTLPNSSPNFAGKKIDPTSKDGTKAAYNMDSIHKYGSSSKVPLGETADDETLDSQDHIEPAGHKGNGKYAYNFDWKSSIMSPSQSPSDIESKLDKYLSKGDVSATSEGTLSDDPPDKVFVGPKGSFYNPDVVPGFTFDMQGEQFGPLFLPNAPPELGEDTGAETVLMVPPTVNKLEKHRGTKEGQNNEKSSRNENRKDEEGRKDM